jgi:hypothetical protein
MDYYDIYDIINATRLKAGEEDMSTDEAFELLIKEIVKMEYE